MTHSLTTHVIYSLSGIEIFPSPIKPNSQNPKTSTLNLCSRDFRDAIANLSPFYVLHFAVRRTKTYRLYILAREIIKQKLCVDFFLLSSGLYIFLRKNVLFGKRQKSDSSSLRAAFSPIKINLRKFSLSCGPQLKHCCGLFRVGLQLCRENKRSQHGSRDFKINECGEKRRNETKIKASFHPYFIKRRKKSERST